MVSSSVNHPAKINNIIVYLSPQINKNNQTTTRDGKKKKRQTACV